MSCVKLVVGLTGGIGSGKSTVAELFAKLGATVIDTDQLARTLTQPDQIAFKLIVSHFGEALIQPDGSLDRQQLRNIVFASPEQRLWLEQLLHPLIRQEIKRQVSLIEYPYCLVAIPLLFETEPNPIIDRVLVIDTPESLQLTRAQARDKLSAEQALLIMAAQVSRSKRLEGAHDVIVNDKTIDDLTPQVQKLHQFYLGLCLSIKDT
jgi:dephospho-CoA kinase